ncbi:MAG: TrkH family potassium uptake protein [Oscillospiraceae bacterium]|nr:TrkH family potassium uptake protein [Oscillospiraceae bacterium]
MNYRMISGIVGKVLSVEAVFMLPALLIAAYTRDGAAALGFCAALAAALAAGLPLGYLIKPKTTEIFARDGLVAVGLAWLSVSLFGALPFLVSGAIPNFFDAFFETASGFTTTGATILSDVEALGQALLYWRSFTHWLGGMGVLVFLLVLNPLTGRNSGENMHLLRAESPGVRITKLVPRMRDSASILYLIYIALTVVQVLLLLCGRNTLFDSVTLAFGTAGTGGFAVRNDSIASYSPYTQWVITVFMFLFSVNFNLYFLLLLGQVKKAAANEELRGFLVIILISVAAIMVNTRHYFASFWESARHVFFTVLTILSTSGYVTVDFDRWPQFSRTVLVLLMFVGACAGSTGGGLKVVRVQLLLKTVHRAVRRAFRPNSVRLIHNDGEIVDDRTVASVSAYILLYCVLIAGAAFLISVDGFSLETNFSAALSCMSNVGPGMDAVGAVQNYGGFSNFSKLVLTLTMLTGRLEIYPMLVLFFPSVWKR